MSDFVLSCCSTADLSADYFKKRNIPYALFHYTIDGVEYPDDLGQTMSFDDFYRITKEKPAVTSQVNSDSYKELFTPFLEEGKDILHLSFSSGLSGSCNSARIAAEDLSAKFPDRRIYVVDTLAASSGFGLLVDAAADLRDSGADIEYVRRWVEENKLRLHHWFFATDLSAFKRGGRISGAAALAGTLLGICPLLNVSNVGTLVPRKKVKGKKKVIEEIVSMMEKHAENGLNYSGKFFLSHSAVPEDAEAVVDLVKKRFPKVKEILINSVGTTIGAHTGVGTVAIFFFGDERVD